MMKTYASRRPCRDELLQSIHFGWVIRIRCVLHKTDPPRKCKIPGCNQVAMMTGKVDNTYVNTVHVNESYFLVTDSHVWIEFDPSTLSVHDEIHWDKKDNADLHITELGSAHPLKRPNHPNSLVALKTAFAMMPGMEKTLIEIYSVDSDVKPVKQRRLARFDTSELLLTSRTKGFTLTCIRLV